MNHSGVVTYQTAASRYVVDYDNRTLTTPDGQTRRYVDVSEQRGRLVALLEGGASLTTAPVNYVNEPMI